MSLTQVLPQPTMTNYDREDDEGIDKPQKNQISVVSKFTVPPYGHRKDFIPRNQDMFGDGGAFPEIHVAQYPLNMGYVKNQTSNAIQLQIDADGKPKFDAIVKQNVKGSKIVYSNFVDLLPKEVREDDPSLQKPSEEDLKEQTEKTRQALEALVSSKVSAALPVQHAEKTAPVQYIRYTPSQQGASFNSGAKQRIIQMVEVQKDPMEPPRFKINKKLPRGPPSPPAPILHSPTRKVTVKEQQDWKIPPCISNWKNAKGYTIPLDKRLAADGRGLQSTHINENFAKLAEALYTADLKAREAVDMRAKVEKQIAKKQKEDKEERLRELALHARTNRAGIYTADKSDDQSAERDQIRQERHKERQRAAALQRAGGDKRNRPKERDVSEQIALGVQSASDTGVQYDQRLFNMSAGFGSGLGDDEAYNVYDQPWNSSTAVASQIYKPTKTTKDNYDDAEALVNASKRFEQERGFKGADRAAPREGPVQFQREEDPFGLSDFLKNVRHGGASGSAPSANPSSNSSSKRGNADDREERSNEKRRKK
jgi:SNW domain-containing protein 1